MKKILQFYTCLILLFSVSSFGQDTQSAFYDAKFIYERCFDKKAEKFIKQEELYEALSGYYPEGIDISVLKENPFFGEYVPDLVPKSADESTEYKDNGMSPSFLGGMDVTKVANALADVMLSHAKQELTIAFFNRFKKFSDENPEFKALFPKTASNLRTLLSYKYTEMLPALRTGFFEDINNLTLHVDDVLLLPRYAHLIKEFPEMRIAVNSLRIAREIAAGGMNAADAIKQFAAMENWDLLNAPAYKNMGNALKLAAVFSESLRETSGTVWVTPATASALFKNEPALKIYLGLLYQQCITEKIQFIIDAKDVTFADTMAKYADVVEVFHNKITDFIILADNLQKAKGQDNPVEYVNASVDLLIYLFDLTPSFGENIQDNAYMGIVKSSCSLYKSMNNKQYNQAVTDAFNLLEIIGTFLQEKDKEPKFCKFVRAARPYALFMANVSNAKSEEEIEAALESVILPVGSSYVKKYSKFNLAIQSYLGARYSTGSNKSFSGSWGDDFGVSAPIGIAASWGFKKAGSITLFAPLIDLGAIVDYKLDTNTTTNPDGSTSTTTNKNYKIELGQLFSPGAYVVYGLPYNIPLSVGFGGQYGPGLSKVSDSDVEVNNNPYWRWSVFLSVDIPLFNLRNTPRSDR